MAEVDGTGARIAHLGHSRLDLDRARRTGLPEAVYAAGKTPAQCVDIVRRLLDEGDDPIIVTRAAAEHLEALAPLSPASVAGSSCTWRHRPLRTGPPVVVVSGGTSDAPVVDEALATLTACGAPTAAPHDVGVAGLHRLLEVVPELQDAAAIIAVAGMEGALPTVLGGLVAPPIITVPTSVGYGSSLEGVTALLSSLASCAPGLTVVGIANGYGAACAALRLLRRVDAAASSDGGAG